ncbi:unnamed protein product [Sympodiomycopsis kandeliae]
MASSTSTMAPSPPLSPSGNKKFSTISAFVSKANADHSVKNIFSGSHHQPSTNSNVQASEMASAASPSLPANHAASNDVSTRQGSTQTRISSSRGEDGPWSVSVALADPPPIKQQDSSSHKSRRGRSKQSNSFETQVESPFAHGFTVYITNPTHNLTLQRSILDITDLDAKIREGQSSINTLPSLPHLPAPNQPSTAPASGGRRILQTISRTLSPGGGRNRVALGQISSSLAQQNGTNSNNTSASAARTPPQATDYAKQSPASVASTIKAPKPRRGYATVDSTSASDFNGSAADNNAESEGGAASDTKKTTSALAVYLTTISNIPAVRKSKAFRRFVRVGSEDLQSVRIERRVHRVRSDLAKHVKHSVAPRNTNVGVGPSQSDVGEDGGRTDDERDAASISVRSASRQSNALRRPGSSNSDQLQTSATLSNSGIAPHIPSRSASTDIAPPSGAPSPSGSSPHLGAAAGAAGGGSVAKRSSPNFEGIPEEAEKEKEAGRDQSTRHTLVPTSSTGDTTNTDTAATTLADTSAESSALEDVKKRERRRKRRDADKVTVDDFEMIRVLGKGCAGKVLLVRHKVTTSLFAMKAIHKKHVLAHQELQHTLTEQAVLKRMAREVQDPFVVKLWSSFHDKNNLYLVMDFHPGGDLATQLSRWGRLGRDRARFYAAEIVEGVEGLHKAGVIYRDLKPENVLIGSDGHIVLSDFGLSKEFPSRAERMAGSSTSPPSSPQRANSITDVTKGTSGRPHWMSASEDDSARSADGARWKDYQEITSTFCGTAEYLAPEVIQGSSYSYEVDWWSFGTMLYEMLTGITPFWADTHADMYVRVLHDELVFPDDRVLDNDTKSILRGLLQRSPQLRMKEPRIKRHPYFSMIEWAHVFHKRYIPPYIPPIDPKNAMDTQNFDETFLDMQPVVNGDDDEVEGLPEGEKVEDQPAEKAATEIKSGRQGNTDSTADGSKKNASADAGSSKPTAADGKSLFDGYSFRGRKDSGSIRSSVRSDSMSVAPSNTQAGEQAVSPGAAGSAPIKPSSIAATTSAQPSPAAAIINAHKAKNASKDSNNSAHATPRKPTVKDKEVPSPKPHDTPKAAPAAARPVTPPRDPQPEQQPASEESEDEETATRNAVLALAALEREASAENMSQNSASVSTQPTSIGVAEDKDSVERVGSIPDESISNVTATKTAAASTPSRARSSGLPTTHETIAETDDEDEDWDLIDNIANGNAAPSETNGGRGQNLFARGVVDTYRLLRRQDSSRLGPTGGVSTPGMSTPPRPFSRLSRRHKTLHRPSRGDLTSGSAASLESASNAQQTQSRGLMTPSSSVNVGVNSAPAQQVGMNNNASIVTFEDQQGSSTQAPPSMLPAGNGRVSASLASSEEVGQSGVPEGPTLALTPSATFESNNANNDKRQSRIKRRFTTFFEQATR